MLPLHTDTERLNITLWCELEPLLTFEGEEFPLSEKGAIKRVLEEARIVFSAMIYGYSFTYTPYDKQRGVSEYFHLEPLAEIQWGDPHLEVIKSEVNEKRLYITVHYVCMDFQTARIQIWQSLAVPAAYGRGTGDYFKGYKEKITALENAIKEAVRDYMRKRTFNKPREITGEVLLVDTPDTIIHSGEYVTTVKVKLNIKEVIPYKVF